MSPSNELLLNERLGLLRAVCEQRSYFAAEDVAVREAPLGVAVERYGKEGVPSADAVVFQIWGTQPIIAGLLSDADANAALPFIRCAAVAQQALGAKAVDMLVILIGPQGSGNDENWASAAAKIEDDDRICRKIVWLPDGDATASAEELLSRSPLARPWRGATSIEGQAGTLDKLIGATDPLDDFAYSAHLAGKTAREFLEGALTA